MIPPEMLDSMEWRRKQIDDYKSTHYAQEKAEMVKFVQTLECSKCGVTGSFTETGLCYYTDPGGYVARCKCGNTITYGYDSIPHWNISNMGVVSEVSGRKLMVWMHL